MPLPLTCLQTNDLEANALAPLQAWIKEYRTFKEKLGLLDNKRLEFDHERRAHNKLELKSVRSKQANDRVEPELAGKIESKGGDVAGNLQYLNAVFQCSSAEMCLHLCHMCPVFYIWVCICCMTSII